MGRLRTVHVVVEFDVLTTIDERTFTDAAKALNLKPKVRTRLNEMGFRLSNYRIEAEEVD